MKTFLSILLFMGVMVQSLTTSAQTSVQIGTGTLSPANTLYGPVYRYSSTSTTDGARTNMLWTAAEMAAAGIPSGAMILGVEFNKTNTANFNGTVPFKMLVANTSNTALTTSDTWANLLTTHTQVINNPTFNLPNTAGWVPFTFGAPFVYTGGALEIATEHDISALASPHSTDKITWEYTDGHDTKIVGVANPTGATLNGTVAAYKKRPNIKIIYTSTPCTAPPTAGTAVASVTSVCSNVDFTLNMTGGSLGLGQTYQWESASASTGPWTAIGTPSGSISLTRSQTATTFYRLAITCSGQTSHTNVIEVNTNSTPLAGTFTIDKNNPGSATNFLSFTEAVSALICRGVSAPVTFNVNANSGPYTETVVIPEITGASATNKIIFNGNGNTLTFATSSANRDVIRLDGADYITINNLNIQSTDVTYGWGIHLQNGADNNTISNNTITIASTSTTESNSVGIAFANSLTTVTTTGNTGNGNIVTGNTITGAYKGIHLNGIVTGTGNNQVTNNIIKDFYASGIEVSAANATLVEGNDISRAARATTTTFYGINVSAGSIATQVSKNRIHNTNDTDVTGTVYGLYITASDAAAGTENVFSNNVLYNLNTTGAVYAIYNSGSDFAKYFHNTVNMDHLASTGIGRGFYQTGAATGITFQNNIIVIKAGATGVKHAMYMATATSTISSNGNIFYLNGGASTSGIGYKTSNQVTLANWQTASGQDANSLVEDPQFTNIATADFTPTNALINNTGQGNTGILTDITGLARNPNAPDPGAYEFMNNTTDLGITAITSPNSSCGLTATEIVTVIATNFGTTSQSNIPVSYTINNGTPVNETIPGPLAPGATVTYSFTATADLSAQGGYTIVAATDLTGDLEPTNNSTTKVVANSRFTTLPQLNFESATTGSASMRIVTNAQSNVHENTDASLGAGSTKGMILEGVTNTGWVMPVNTADPWTMNTAQFAAAYICFDPAGGAPNAPLWLSFDLKQTYKTANANTNFRVTVNGVQVGPTYRPPFAGTPIDWQKIYVDLTPYKGLTGIEIGFESSAMEAYANGAGTGNLIDNIQIVRLDPTGVKENALSRSLNVYPNPSAGTFTVSLPQGKAFELEVTDLTGKVILKQSAKTNTTQVNLQAPAKGIYLLKVTSEGKTAIQKLVIQ